MTKPRSSKPFKSAYELNPQGEKRFADGEKKFFDKHEVEMTNDVNYCDHEDQEDATHQGNTTKDKTRKTDKTNKANVEPKNVDEEHMTAKQKERREKIVKAMKTKVAGFKKRYGERAKDVMYATATKTAMGESMDGATSDNPGAGSSSVGGGTIDKSQVDAGHVHPDSRGSTQTKDVLEKIAMQAAELHDSLDDKELDGDIMGQLTEIKDSLDQVFETITNSGNKSDKDKTDDSAPDAEQGREMKTESYKPMSKGLKNIVDKHKVGAPLTMRGDQN